MESPAKQLPVPKPAPLTTQEREAEKLIYAEVGRLQRIFKHMDFSREAISAKRKSDQLFAYRVIAIIGTEYIGQFLSQVEQQLKNLDKNAFGKLPGKAPAPRSLGLILEWAIQYAESMDEAARQDTTAKEQWKVRHLKACQEIMADPNETAEAKAGARKILEGYALEGLQTA